MFFDRTENQKKLLDEIKKWKGTNFQYNCGGEATPGLTADCVSFPLGVFRNLKLIPESFISPQYFSVHGGRAEYTKLIECLAQLPNLELVWEKRPDKRFSQTLLCIGDVIVCSSGTQVHHVLIYTGKGCAWHCWPKIGVSRVPIVTCQIFKHAQRIYRFSDAQI